MSWFKKKLPPKPVKRAANTQSRGTLEACPCPWCRKPNDFSDVEDFGLWKGAEFKCDHCSRKFRIAQVRPVTMIWLSRA